VILGMYEEDTPGEPDEDAPSPSHSPSENKAIEAIRERNKANMGAWGSPEDIDDSYLPSSVH